MEDINNQPSLLQRVLDTPQNPLALVEGDDDGCCSKLGVHCICSCGNEIVVCAKCLVEGQITSCGECD
jgi:hypothetical protein